jgi:hypothetical protein
MSGVSLNGSARQNAQTMQALSAQGFIKGLPDLVLYLPDGKLLNLELKKPSGGVQSSDQLVVETKLRALGHTYHIIRSTEQVFDLIAANTSTDFRESQYKLHNLPTTPILTESFMYWQKGTRISTIEYDLAKLYRI